MLLGGVKAQSTQYPQGEITVGGSLTVLSCRDGVKISPLLLPNPILVFSAENKRRITKDVFQGF